MLAVIVHPGHTGIVVQIYNLFFKSIKISFQIPGVSGKLHFPGHTWNTLISDSHIYLC
jgi:hypothetical protein